MFLQYLSHVIHLIRQLLCNLFVHTFSMLSRFKHTKPYMIKDNRILYDNKMVLINVFIDYSIALV